MQWTQWNSDIWWWGYCLWCKKVPTAYCIHWFDLFVSKTMSQPPYTTIPLHPLVWPFCVPTTNSITVYCIHLWPFCTTMSPYIQLLHTESTVYCIHCLFAPKTIPSYTTSSTVSLCPSHPLVWHQRQFPTTMHPLHNPHHLLCNSYTTWYLFNSLGYWNRIDERMIWDKFGCFSSEQCSVSQFNLL